MQISVQIEQVSDISKKLNITVPAAEVERQYQSQLMTAQKTAKVKGFREGHVPLDVVKKLYGHDLEHQLYHHLVEHSLNQAIVENKLRAVGEPSIAGSNDHDHHNVIFGKDFTYSATIEVIPEFEVKSYQGISLKRDAVEIAPEEIEKLIGNFLDHHSTLEPVARSSKEGDFVQFKFEGQLMTSEGPKAVPSLAGERMEQLGSQSLLPDFENNITGASAGDTRTFKISYPADYPQTEFAGKEAEFKLDVLEVKEKKLPELNEGFAQELGFESIEKMRETAKTSLLKRKTDETTEKLRQDLLAVLIEKNPMSVPQSLIHSQARDLAREFSYRLEQDGFDKKWIEQTVQSQEKDILERAEAQVKASLILMQIAKKEGIKVKQADFDQELKTLANSSGRKEDEIRAIFSKNPNRRENFEFKILEEKTIQFLFENSKIS